MNNNKNLDENENKGTKLRLESVGDKTQTRK
jgi:hypothetical protein